MTPDPLKALKALTKTPETPLDQLEHLHDELVAKRPTKDIGNEMDLSEVEDYRIHFPEWPDPKPIPDDETFRIEGYAAMSQSQHPDPELVAKRAEAVSAHRARLFPEETS